MGRKDQKSEDKVEAVLHFLRKNGSPLSLKQEKFCNAACVERFLKAKGESVKKAAKQLRACLTWRESIGTEQLIADEFSAELAEGVAYVAGQDEEARPVMVFRIKQDYQKFHSQKLYIRLLAFTLEVAIASMSKNVQQFVLLFDAGFFRSASACLNFLLATFKILMEYYPGRLAKAFVIDPPSLFSYLWKGVRPFVELSAVTTVVSSLDFDHSRRLDNQPALTKTSNPLSCTSRFSFNVSQIDTLKPWTLAQTEVCSTTHSPSLGPALVSPPSARPFCSSRFSFNVSQIDTLKPWTLTHTELCPTAPSPSLSPAFVSTLNARSFSFTSPVSRTPTVNWRASAGSTSFPSTPSSLHQQQQKENKENRFSSFLPSLGGLFKKDSRNNGLLEQQQQQQQQQTGRESFRPFLGLYMAPYNELGYRAKMKAPLGGLISIVSSHARQRTFAPYIY